MILKFLTAGLGLGVDVFIHEAVALTVDMQEAVARGTGFEVNRCGVVVVLLHDTADLHGHDMAVARVGLRGIVDLSIHAQRVGRIALAHFHVRRIAAGGDDDALLGMMRV